MISVSNSAGSHSEKGRIQIRMACRLFHQWILNSTGLIMKVAGFVTWKRGGREGEGEIQVTFRCDAAAQLYNFSKSPDNYFMVWSSSTELNFHTAKH